MKAIFLHVLENNNVVLMHFNYCDYYLKKLFFWKRFTHSLYISNRKSGDNSFWKIIVKVHFNNVKSIKKQYFSILTVL